MSVNTIKMFLHRYIRIVFLFFVISVTCIFLIAQPFSPNTKKQATGSDGLFDSDEILEIRLQGDLRQVLNNREDNKKKFPITLSYKTGEVISDEISIKASTRGHFRLLRENCNYPPLLLHFTKASNIKSTPFSEQRKLKLVMPCKDDDYLMGEWLTYRIYNLVTPLSFRARLVKVTIDDSRSKKTSTAFYGILIEEEDQLASRNNMNSVKTQLLPQQLDTESFLRMAVFQYLIGNTDWSIQYLQNIKLLTTSKLPRPIPVPYDFDHAGIVNAPYALPAEELRMSSIRERRYRGFCIEDLSAYDSVLVFYNGLKDKIYDLFNSCTLISDRYRRSTITFLDDFYKTINNPKTWQRDFAYPCDKNGTGNVVIKGLKED